MARGRDPALPLYADEFTRDTKVQSLPRELRGPLVHLWCIAWMEGPIRPSRIRGVARLIDASVEETTALLGGFFFETDQGWISQRLEDERSQRMEHRERQVAAGKKAAKSRWGNRTKGASGPECDRNATASESNCDRIDAAVRSDSSLPLPHTLPHSQDRDQGSSALSSEESSGHAARTSTRRGA